MELRQMILAQSAAAVGIPVLLRREAPSALGEEQLRREYLRQSERGLALLDEAAAEPDAEDESAGGATVLALNFHDIPTEHRPVVREQLRRVADHGPSFLTPPRASSARSVLVAFYDGYREAALFGAEECERLGLRALFLPIFRSEDPARAGLTDADLADLATAHSLGFHTASHRSGPEIGESSLAVEVREPVRRLTAAQGGPPLLGAYRGGGRFDPVRPADRLLRELGVRWWLSNWSLERVPDEGAGPG